MIIASTGLQISSELVLYYTHAVWLNIALQYLLPLLKTVICYRPLTRTSKSGTTQWFAAYLQQASWPDYCVWLAEKYCLCFNISFFFFLLRVQLCDVNVIFGILKCSCWRLECSISSVRLLCSPYATLTCGKLFSCIDFDVN